MFFENDDDDDSYTMIDKYLYDEYFGHKDSYYYYYIHADKILLFKKSDYKYFIRYNDVYDIKIRPLQLKIDHFYSEIRKNANNNLMVYIYSDDKNLFKKCREIWNNITESIGIINAKDFVETTLDDGDKFIAADVHKNTSFVEGNYRNKLVIVLHSVIDNYLQTSLIQVKTHKCT